MFFKIRLSFYFSFILAGVPAMVGLAQEPISEHHLYLLSNLESLPADAPVFQSLEQHLKTLDKDYTVLVLGDFIDKNGLGTKPSQKDIAKIDRLIQLGSDRGNLVFVPGDREWDNGSERGLLKLKALEKYLESKMDRDHILLPEKGCLGPSVIDIGGHIRIAAINTQWFFEENIRPEEEDVDCGLLNQSAFWAEAQDVLEDADNRNLIVVGHHPVMSFGQYAGYRLWRDHFKPPLIGSLIASYRQSVGGPRDLNNHRILGYRKQMKSLAEQFPGALFLSGHEYDTQLLLADGNYHINGGAVAEARPVGRGLETQYRRKKPGLVRLVFHPEGAVDFQVLDVALEKQYQIDFEKRLYTTSCGDELAATANPHFKPCEKEMEIQTTANPDQPISADVVASTRYEGGFLKRMVLGEHYRDSWSEKVHDIPYLRLDTFAGGLTPYGKGGGAQTLSLKFNSADGRRFSFRSIDKNPTKRMDQDLSSGLWGTISRDKTSHQHPYAMLSATYLQEVLGLPHTEPQLFIMPDDPRLGPWREEFAGMFGTLELKPQGAKKTDNPYRGAYDVDHTLKMYQKLLKDNDNKIDVPAFVQARIFDMWISDWDRHVKNWKWLGYKNEDGEYFFKPFPKDRDKAFSKMNGSLWLVQAFHFQKDKVTFSKTRYGLKYLNWKNRTMDRWLANSFAKEDWMQQVDLITNAMTDSIILAAIDQLPPEVLQHDRDDIFERLVARRELLPRKIKKYYRWLAKEVDLIGSDSRELFEVDRLENGDVLVRIYDTNKTEKKQDLLFERLFKYGETKEIRLYGLGKDDFFRISGAAKKSIRVRVIGGKGSDLVEDKSTVEGLGKKTFVYDERDQDQLTLGETAKKKNSYQILNFASEEFFTYNYLQVLPNVAFNQDDGVVFGLNGTYTRQAFNKPGFSSRYTFGGAFTTNQNYNLNVNAQFRHVLGELDLVTGVNVSSWDRSFRRFYGLSNENTIEEDLRASGFYENRTATFLGHLGFTKEFWQRSNWTLTTRVDVRNVEPNPGSSDGNTIYDVIEKGNGRGSTPLLGPHFSTNIDLRNNPNFPTKGLQWTFSGFHFWNMEEAIDGGGRIETELSTFFTAGVRMPVTLSLRSGYISTYGDLPFYHKAFIGQIENHRGFLRNRFGGDAAVFFNTDLRFHLGKFITPLVPVKYGIFGLYDLGRTWNDQEISDRWHAAVGGGVYIIPYADSFNLTFTVAKSEERAALYSFRLGFFVR